MFSIGLFVCIHVDMMSILLLCSGNMSSFYAYSLVLLLRVDNFALMLSFTDFIILYVHICISHFVMFSHLFAAVILILYIDDILVCV